MLVFLPSSMKLHSYTCSPSTSQHMQGTHLQGTVSHQHSLQSHAPTNTPQFLSRLPGLRRATGWDSCLACKLPQTVPPPNTTRAHGQHASTSSCPIPAALLQLPWESAPFFVASHVAHVRAHACSRYGVHPTTLTPWPPASYITLSLIHI